MVYKSDCKTDYQKKVHDIFFKCLNKDLLYKDDITPYLKDEFRFKRAMTLLDNPKNKTIYDLGAYPGTSIFYFGELNSLIGLGKTTPDFSKKIKIAGHSIIDVNFEHIRKDDLPCDADIVLVMEILEHIRMSYNFLYNISLTVKPGGLLYLTTNNQSYIGYLIKLLFNKEILDPIKTEDTNYPGHCRYYSLKEITNVFKKFGFEILESNHINFLPKFHLYKNEKFGAIKNTLVKILPMRYSTHIEILVKRPLK